MRRHLDLFSNHRGNGYDRDMSTSPKSNETPFAEAVAGVRRLLASDSANIACAPELTPLLDATNSRAVGCWRHVAGELQLAGFLAVEEMPAEVQAGFVAATRRAALTQTQFGIVQAVTRSGPALNHRSADPNVPVVGSIGWLGRLEAASSLAVPIYREQELIGALAVATKLRVEPDDAVWKFVTALAAQI
jgi:GAF domain-containing protein